MSRLPNARALYLLGVMLLTLLCNMAHALDPSLRISQYSLDTWQIPQGLPQMSVQGIARTPDGYL